ncbi:hypothetical protein BFAG_03960 [Bacteroides fragilis 3_1_12]|uniref:Uncharacterized protein n=1 Tax=Bacteroides fragilis 3_1_12 TaxID=457424 RepID=A0ABN0BQN7_BACFG|nr:hypothetical protein BFAG_03960 [Bacteroides fragilis 3_1_12]
MDTTCICIEVINVVDNHHIYLLYAGYPCDLISERILQIDTTWICLYLKFIINIPLTKYL